MNQQELEAFIQELGPAIKDTDLKPGYIVYKIPEIDKIFAILKDATTPIRVEVKTDTRLSKHLRTKYESVLLSQNMSPKDWIEVLCTGQLTDDEVKDLIRLSRNLVANSPE